MKKAETENTGKSKLQLFIEEGAYMNQSQKKQEPPFAPDTRTALAEKILSMTKEQFELFTYLAKQELGLQDY